MNAPRIQRRGRPLLFAVVVILTLVCGGVRATRSSAASDWRPLGYSHGDSGCSGREDPLNFEVKGLHVNFAFSFAVDETHGGASGAGMLARAKWNGGIGSTHSWVHFNGTPASSCIDETDWATSSHETGHHVRFWQYQSNEADIIGAVHEDCPVWHHAAGVSWFTHSSRYYDRAASQLQSWMVGLRTTSGDRAFFRDPASTYNGRIGVRKDRQVGFTYHHCGTYGDEIGLVYSTIQKASTVKIGVSNAVKIRPPEQP